MSGVPWYIDHAGWLSVPLAVAIVLLGRWLVVYVGASRSRHQAGDRRQELGTPLDALTGRHEDEVVTLAGRLEVRGEPTENHHDGSPCAASTFESSAARTWHEPPELETHADRRAEMVVLVSPVGVIPLRGALTVKAGSREHWPGVPMRMLEPSTADRIEADSGFDPRGFDDFAVFRAVDDGDEVVARGTMSRSRPEGGARASYREQAVTWEMKPDGVAIALAADRAPKTTTRDSLLLAGPGITLGLGLIAYTALLVEVDPAEAAARCHWSCISQGHCDPQPHFGLLGTEVSCAPTTPRPCERMQACDHEGRCTPNGDTCIATDDADCRRTDLCRLEGHCSARDGWCVVATREDCADTRACQQSGQCSPVGKGRDAFCGFATDEDCEKHLDCRLKGLCTVRGDRCVASARGCLHSERCQQEGLCSPNASGVCAALRDEDCEGSVACTAAKRCFHGRGACLSRRRAEELRQRGERGEVPDR